MSRLRTEEVLVKEGEKLVDGRLQPVYVTLPSDSDYTYAEKEAVDHELRLQRGPAESISYSTFVFDDKAMAALRYEQRNNDDRGMTQQLEEMKKMKSNVLVSPCAGCGTWPAGWSRKRALRKAYESPPVATCLRGPALNQAQTTNSLEVTAHE